MKFFTAIVLVALVALASAEDAAKKLDQVQGVEPVANSEVEQPESARNKRGFVLSAYSAPLTAAAVPVAAAPYTAAYTAPVAYAAGVPYAYSAYNAYSPYYSYPSYYL